MEFPRNLTMAQAFFLPLRLTPFHAGLRLVHRIIGAFKTFATVMITAACINTALAVRGKTAPYQSLFPPRGGLVLLLLWDHVVGPLVGLSNTRQSIKLRLLFREPFIEKRVRLDYRYVETPQVWDMVSRTWGSPEDKIMEFWNAVLELANLLISAGSVFVVLAAQVWWAALISVAVTIPLLYLAVQSGKKQYDAEKEVSRYTRKNQFLSRILTSREAALERKLFGFSAGINKDFRKEFDTARKYLFKVEARRFVLIKSVGLAGAAVSSFALFMLIPPVLAGTLSIGLFISLTGALFNMINNLSWSLPWQLSQLSRFREYIKDVNGFFALDEVKDAEALPAETPPDFESLEFRDVSFAYPGTEKKVLDGLSLKIEKGKRYSFVGKNGAGKTTIAKLMTRLYSGYEGEILLNGRDIKTWGMGEIKAAFCAVFQDFAKYQISLGDNIGLGKIRGADEEEIKRAADTIGLSEAAAKLPGGFKTNLGKIKDDGVDLSGGEWQRAAMARGVISPAPLKILDEPTAALDPIGESRLYEKFEEISRGFTTIFISHRLGSTKLADTIFVLDGGKIVESGSHSELMAQAGLYAEMFESQREWYV
ncbi:MAG: ABC transporter ATP-binding protein/permease [Treponema sp.]|jgi:ATP-binding cassette subfamily B protein|nr:ABC transporter ATP-binding protein/permease [Treponema sp.]